MPVQDPMERLRLELHDAAEREMAPVVRRRRRVRRTGLALAGALLVSAGAATGVGLIEEGSNDPVGDRALGKAYGSKPTAGTISMTLPGKPLPFAVLAYHNREGKRCVQAGQLRGNQLGVVEDGKFHPYGQNRPGACIAGRDKGTTTDTLAGGRRLVFGRAPVGTKTVKVAVNNSGATATGAVAKNGAFIVSLGGDVRSSQYQLTYSPPRVSGSSQLFASCLL